MIKGLTNITSLFLSCIIFIASTGFMHEHYFCSKCRAEHHEISLFEFGEVTHDHDCASQHKACLCNNKKHLSNTSVVFYSLKEVFIDGPTQIDFKNICTDITNLFCNTFFCTAKIEFKPQVLRILKIPAPPDISGNTKIQTILSIFRL